MNLPKNQLATVLSAVWLRNSEVNNDLVGICFDSRKYNGESIFIALQGEQIDSHDLLTNLDRQKITLFIVEKQVALTHPDADYLLVKNCKQALIELAIYKRKLFSGIVISVTGSSGKTTFQNWLTMVLREKYKVHHPQASFNNNIGLPATLIDAPNDAQIIVLELGTNNKGEIDLLSKIAQANYSVLLNVGMAHLGRFNSPAELYHEKLAIFNNMLAPKIGFIPSDDNKLTPPQDVNIIKFNNICTFISQTESKTKFSIKIEEKNYQFETDLVGEHVAINLSLIYLICCELGINIEQIIVGFSKLKPVLGRFNIIQFTNFTIIDDCYNANPNSVINLILSLKKFKNPKKILVLGELAEIESTIDQAVELIKPHLSTDLNIIIAKGNFALKLKQAMPNFNIIHFEDDQAMLNAILKEYIANCLMAFKGSRISKLELIMDQVILLANK